MNHDLFASRRLTHLAHSVLLLGGMVGILSLMGIWLLGSPTIPLMIVALSLLFSLGARFSPRWVLRSYRARPLHPQEAPGLYRLVGQLARRAQLPKVPSLHVIPSREMNALAMGGPQSAALAITEGLARRLDSRELAGVLAHEISHIAHRDLWVLGLAETVRRLTSTLAFFGQLLLLLMLPLALFGQTQIPILLPFALLLAPGVSLLLQLALSRTRELQADQGAAHLTGDPLGLASALAKLEASQGNWLRRLLWPSRPRNASFLASHPPTRERIERLRALAGGSGVRIHRTAPAPALSARRLAGPGRLVEIRRFV